ncbi:sugar transferase [Mobilicoccus caccae]|uniref:Exopolysaccharide biosynthesis polyprenyl glycosylphosphotransferase n=1 Tax=Mobilicoccus caccae TaxID=1859295 RepID=A0ABQ6IRZ8_9MICO|nr:sugar transferase [Mobilicoccus caccae]GMA40705.1 exopolysaccharide biosynthesis polyprenyl glycosylphosphotransferase [Mobilicoccus caccae]
MSVPPSDLPFAPTLGSTAVRTPTTPAWVSKYLVRVVSLDVLVGVVAALLASLLRFGEALTWQYVLLSLFIPPMWVLALGLSNAYERRFLGVAVEEYRSVTRAVVGVLAVLAVSAFILNVLLARLYVLILLPVLLLGGLLARFVTRRWLLAGRARGDLMQRTVVVGRADAVGALVRSVKSEPSQGLMPVAVCASGLDGDWNMSSDIEGVPVSGRPRDAVAVADRMGADVVAVASHPDLAGKALRRLAWALEERGVELIVSPGLLDVAGPRLSIRPSSDLSLLHIERPAAGRRSVILKQLMDRTLAALLVLALSPILIVTALAIRFTDPGPILFRQKRVGIRGELFDIYKFRTMVVDAEAKLAALQARSQGNGVLFKMQNDPRVTKVGAILRRYSIDELPQLFNVILGDMSLVGPRPPLPAEVAEYEPDALRRLHVRPGMTGLWQVSGRSDLSWEESLRLDLRYVDNWSPIGDLRILLRTFQAVTRGSGAY